MWPFEDELEIWFAEVDKERNAKYSPDNDSSGDDMMQNDFAAGRR